MLKTYTEFKEYVKAFYENVNFWTEMASKYEADSKFNVTALENAKSSQEILDRYYNAYPTFGTMFKLEMSRKARA